MIIYLCLFVFIIFDDLIKIYTDFSLAGKLSILSLSFFVFLLLFKQKKYQLPKNIVLAFGLFLLYVFLNLIISVIQSPSTIYMPSVLYEIFKLSIVFSFAIFLLLPNDVTIKFIQLGVKVLSVFIFINLFVLILQHIFGADIIKYFGISSGMEFQFKNNRPSGITTGANIIGDSALFITILFYFLRAHADLFKIQSINMLSYSLYASILVVMLSTSKHALLILLIFPLFIYKFKIRWLLISFVVLIIILTTIFTYNIYGLYDKYLMYKYVFLNFDAIDFSLIEHRVQSIIIGIQSFQNTFPFGTGLGTWGDFSSSFNPNITDDAKYNMPDSYIIHLIVEQGILLLIYLWILWILLRDTKLGIYTFFCVIMIFFPTMGMGSSTFPYIIAFLIMVFNFSRGLRNETSPSL